ncbi:UDP-3-O-[3-hydroxymyristoyl] N-acetylglucosamine deacetylase [Piscirickettsia salmonis]|uniref:UDP-3-O-acyl-N-acetylglucosamine deacetylase n=1 Tax=Piscirickettsia salmonis TaxID=1238 RepID=A0A095BTB9_PISSA|nr:UDP-3-O-acyl-N-acetylglucosamine deacetylase [Piscirickettsia salmonis]RNC78123.1 UDP-3-O-acyl-N-acetylglucosamine deacetylase [Piscirickettsiaceae bacterium NZ-RLO2]AKP72243.1 UDP-3-O-[3-hydroxymyristoyl] N-acetylglucosamine deacetylase [Piscirickettsia salmonis LF-89 = ATCC VR-1361]ALA26505.1 UDP-3-O-[3-hydroxymyristoyl] N-acetylglucosamine deacetylase [Piscirickettsia salmonis]ALB24319.1 UDP-3-O-[3-hydroxymyristoyl] N-acetylglucosamine deacetylase [Piscirickettsia salmonis]ALY04113.1 UDP
MVLQQTLRNTIKATGVGVHTGQEVSIVLKPAPINTGIVFRRIDCDPVVELPARFNEVTSTQLATTLSRGDVEVNTVEHLMSALSGLGIDNLYVDVETAELPIMDGSASAFVFLIESAGVKEQEAPRRYIRVKKAIKVTDGDKFAKLLPHDGFKLSYRIHYDHPVIAKTPQAVSVELSQTRYIKEVARARTFGFVKELDWLLENNLAKGASLENTIAIDEDRIINEDGLRYEDEFVRHKLLDAVGDLSLAGALLAEFEGYKSGHTLNNQLLHALFADPDAFEEVTLP